MDIKFDEEIQGLLFLGSLPDSWEVHQELGDAKPVPTHMLSSSKLYAVDSDLFDEPKRYKSIIEALPYINVTMPNIAYMSISIHRLCSIQLFNIGKLLNTSFNIYKMLIRHQIWMIGRTPLDIAFFLAPISFHGNVQNRAMLAGPALKLNSKLLPPLN
ncbi:hypothetical protein PIB30_008363 [Stylosanthes scabra]|uniref:Uncharacterized protein n=1 Tax=Stylosanthes scabra TaxID=79078 RepID=A0ABU6U4C1_9FABA|nr:hypothetical protein [Stylosanthes scabra]